MTSSNQIAASAQVRHRVEAIGALPSSERPKTFVSASGIDYYGFSSTRVFELGMNEAVITS